MWFTFVHHLRLGNADWSSIPNTLQNSGSYECDRNACALWARCCHGFEGRISFVHPLSLITEALVVTYASFSLLTLSLTGFRWLLQKKHSHRAFSVTLIFCFIFRI